MIRSCLRCGAELITEIKYCKACARIVIKKYQSDRYFRVKGFKPILRRVCYCGEKFETTWESKKYLHEVCRLTAKTAKQRIRRQDPEKMALRIKNKICLQCPKPVTSKSHRVQHCSEECLYVWQLPRLGRKVADKRAYERAVSKRQREWEKTQDNIGFINEGHAPMAIQHMAVEKIDRNWDRILKGLATAPTIAPHMRN